MMFCQKCGHQLADDSAFCNKCGFSTRAVSNMMPSVPVIQVIAAQPAKAERQRPPCSSVNPHVLMVVAVFFGWLGVHNFVCGRPASGIMKILFLVGIVLCPMLLQSSSASLSDWSLVAVGLGIFVFLWLWLNIDLYKIACGGFYDGRGLCLRSAPWGLVFAIPMTILTVILVFCYGLFVFVSHEGSWLYELFSNL